MALAVIVGTVIAGTGLTLLTPAVILKLLVDHQLVMVVLLVDQVMALPEPESQPEVGKFHGNVVVLVRFGIAAAEIVSVTVLVTVMNPEKPGTSDGRTE